MEAFKTCCTCHEVLPIEQFNRRASAIDGRQARCRGCFRKWYDDNREGHISAVRRRNNAARLELQQLLGDYLSRHPCVDCGEADVRCLDFDHRDPATKVDSVSRLVASSIAWATILTEIAKCDVRCANCHRRRTNAVVMSWRQRLFELTQRHKDEGLASHEPGDVDSTAQVDSVRQVPRTGTPPATRRLPAVGSTVPSEAEGR